MNNVGYFNRNIIISKTSIKYCKIVSLVCIIEKTCGFQIVEIRIRDAGGIE